ncbi:phosphoribosylformylglycinamidine cyclo-ligase, partial [Paenibacillus anseongense]
CSLIGGETAEMPGMYAQGEYDIAGFTVGIVDKKKIIDGTTIRPGDVVLGLASSGVHSNGFSLVRRLLLEEKGYTLQGHVDELGDKLGNVLLEPTKLYVKPILAMLEDVAIKGMAHITGGGFIENIPRVLPDGVNVDIQYGSWPILPIFSLMQREGGISNNDMFRTFNMGIGMVIIVNADDAEKAIAAAEAQGEKVYRLGVVTEGERVVTFQGAEV